MKKLLTFLIKKITGSTDFKVELEAQEGRDELVVKANPEIIGLIIGKEGKTIKNLRKILAIKGAVEDRLVNISVTEK